MIIELVKVMADPRFDPNLNHYNDITLNNRCLKYDTFSINTISDCKNKFAVFCFNIRSYHKNIDEFLATIDAFKNKIDVFILTETWLTNSTSSLCSIKGYNAYHSIRCFQTGGGVSVFVKDIYCCHLNLCVNNDVIEMVSAKVKLARNKCVEVVGLYRPPSGNIYSFIHTLEETFDNLKPNLNPTIVGGDFNICLFKSDTDLAAESFSNMMSLYFFIPHITLPTREQNNSSSLIDHIWSNIPHQVISGVLETSVTDHYPIFSLFENFISDSDRLVEISFRDFSKHNAVKFINELSTVNWSCNQYDSNKMTECFLSEFNSLYDKNFPLKRKCVGTKRLMKPWITKSILKSINHKHFLEKQTKLFLYEARKLTLYKNLLTRIIRQSKKMHYDTMFRNAKDNMKKTWKIINDTVGTGSIKNNHIQLKQDDQLINEDKVADTFNNYFCNIAENLLKNIPINLSKTATSYISKSIDSSIYLMPSTPLEVHKTILKLKSNGSGYYSPSRKTFKLSADIISYPISDIFNCILSTGIYPDILKTACVTPIFKSGDSYNVKNYRPISGLPVLNLIIEKLLHSRFVSFIDKNNIIVDEQFGFRRGRCTSDAVTKLLSNIYKSFNNNEYFGAIFLDLSKAFDTVSHTLLLKKLEYYGFRGKSYSLIKSYLQNRKQYVSVSKCNSGLKTMKHGVPQGSVLGPLLFLLYINDFTNCLHYTSSIMYADDTTIYKSGKCISKLCNILENDLNNIVEWFNLNFLTLNIEKTIFTVFSYRHIPSDVKVLLGNKYILNTSTVNFLGVSLDFKLTFGAHIKKIYNKVSKIHGIFYKINKFLPEHILISLYYALIYSNLIYCIEAWGSASAVYINKLFVVQKKVVKLISGYNILDSSKFLFKTKKILKINDIYKIHCLTYMFKIFNSNKNTNFLNEIMNLQTKPLYNTRGNSCLRLPKINILRYKQSLIYQGIMMWNTVPSHIKETKSIFVFKKFCKNLIFKDYD